MTDTRKEERMKLEMVYDNVMALYAALKDGRLDVRRAEFKHGEVAAEPVDFLADVEIKARRHLTITEYILWSVVLTNPEQYKFVPEKIRQTMGRVFQQNRLDLAGDYKKLYFKVKNQQLREDLTPLEAE